jgi:hypothetical protein
MRIFKLKTRWLALIMAATALLLSGVLSVVHDYAVGPHWGTTLFDECFRAFNTPAISISILCLPSSALEEGGQPLIVLPVYFVFFVLQWYLIFFAGIGIYRHFSRRSV